MLERSESPFAFQFNSEEYEGNPAGPVPEAFVEWIAIFAGVSQRYTNIDIKNFKELMYRNSLDSGFDPKTCKIIMKNCPGGTLDRGFAPDWLLREFLEPNNYIRHRKLGYYDNFRNLALVTTGIGEQRFGWIPQSAKVGDLVSLLSGCPRPFVL